MSSGVVTEVAGKYLQFHVARPDGMSAARFEQVPNQPAHRQPFEIGVAVAVEGGFGSIRSAAESCYDFGGSKFSDRAFAMGAAEMRLTGGAK